MCEVVDISDDEDSSVPENSVKCISNDEGLVFDDAPPQITCSRPMAEDVPCSSGSNWILFFAGMGFKPSLVNKVIEEKGEENAEMLLEALLAYSNLQHPKEEPYDDGLSIKKTNDSTAIPNAMELPSKSSELLDSLFGKKKFAEKLSVKEEPEVPSGDMDEKISSMLRMNFSLDEVKAAIDKLGKHASTSQLMDFIFAARMAQKYKKDANSTPGNEESEKKCKDLSNEALFGIMDKTLQLLEMGFSESQISTAFEICGSDASLLQLTNSIVAPETVVKAEKTGDDFHRQQQPFELCVKTEGDLSVVGSLHSKSAPKSKGKMPAEEACFNKPNSKKLKRELTSAMVSWEQNDFSIDTKESFWREIDSHLQLQADRKPLLLPKPSRNLTSLVAKRPYFLFGSTTDLPQATWAKVSQFLYSIQPEFADTRDFSPLCRIEGYVHNLPTEDRFHISPKGPMTLEEAVPSQRKWKPSWDTRKHIILKDCSTHSSSVSHLCNRLGKLLAECEGCPSPEQQRPLLHQMEANNLIWIGNYKLSALQPDHLERIMGYPLMLSERGETETLRLSFQTDALGYHVSVLKRLFPNGVSVLSFFTGLGGAEIALQRLGVRLRGLVSIEPCEVKRRIVKRWWEESGQKGNLVQMESVQKLSSNKLVALEKSLSGFDFVVCRNASERLDFSEFMEFVRVLQRLRSSSSMDRNH